MFPTLNAFVALITGWIETIAESIWVYPAMFLVASLDQFIPPMPSDSVLISLAVASRSVGRPSLFLLIPFAAGGAFCGNIICYLLGKKIGTSRFKRFRQGRGLRAITAARVAIEKRGFVYIIACRFVPIARVAIIMTVGAVHFPFKQFLLASAASALLWAANAVTIGSIAGNVFGNHPLLGMAIGIATGLLVGVILDRVISAILNRK